MKNIMRTILALVCFTSGIIVAFEWMGHDKGQRIYTMLKKPDVVIKEVEVVKIKPVIVSDDVLILATNRAYKETLLKISGMEFNYDDARDNWKIMQGYVDNALNFSDTLLLEEN